MFVSFSDTRFAYLKERKEETVVIHVVRERSDLKLTGEHQVLAR